MFSKKLIFSVILVVLFGIFVLSFNKHTVTINDTVFTVAIANTPALREQGLSNTTPLKQKQGMLFVFDKPDIHGFWMKDMSYPLDFIWINENKQIVSISENVYPESYPAVFYPNTAILYVLEVPAGNAAARAPTRGGAAAGQALH
ncbi:MAG: DUF192 domain-containing protein, partial [bacterium]